MNKQKKKINKTPSSNTKTLKNFFKSKYLIFTAVFMLVFLLDQLFKNLVAKSGIEKKQVIEGIFSITNIHNYGASFGMLQHKTFLLVFFSIVVIVIILAFLRVTPRRLIPFTALMFGGALSNLIDRLAHGYVIDYLDFVFWPSFNIADIAITAGAILIGWYFFREY